MILTEWLDEIPDDWACVPAWSLFSERADKAEPDAVHLTPSQAYGVLPQTEYMEITGNRVVLNLTGADKMKAVYEGDFISHLRSFQGGLEQSSLRGKVSQAYTVLCPSPLVQSGYFRYLMKSRIFIEQLNNLTDQLRDGQTINYARFARMGLPLPPLESQRIIAQYLDQETGEIDAMLAALDELTRNLKQRSGIVVANELKSHYFHGTIPLAFSSGADNFFDGDWVESKDQDPDGDIRLLQLADIGDGTFLDKSNRRINQEAFERLRCREVQAGDILIARMPHPLGRACILPTGLGRTITVVDVAVLRPDPNRVIPKYLVYVLNSISFRAQLDSLQSGSTRQRISRSRLGQQRIPMPPVALQRAAVSHLDEVTGRINAMLAKIDELKALLVERRAALITDVVTGRKKVPA